jgi:hypothetical protein
VQQEVRKQRANVPYWMLLNIEHAIQLRWRVLGVLSLTVLPLLLENLTDGHCL